MNKIIKEKTQKKTTTTFFYYVVKKRVVKKTDKKTGVFVFEEWEGHVLSTKLIKPLLERKDKR